MVHETAVNKLPFWEELTIAAALVTGGIVASVGLAAGAAALIPISSLGAAESLAAMEALISMDALPVLETISSAGTELSSTVSGALPYLLEYI